ncbi:type I 3-dehydroquinate dehydratase [Apilactobacillus kunkeei]|uniref:type I 3-dehydroquinate dehydratase n=1 Tax=Apilactobacillus kunkeei TaxID=148814 RepID=UPI00110CB3E2|nr:type I 3-dehydroquinate dehydratase [Apilactobacillus kunkeei]TMT02264.1 type I 3-dehydroquinate dehydratase [Apilactobacillus kunkeei]
MIDVSKWQEEPTKIAVPITGKNQDEIKREVILINDSIDNIDLIEWRIDYIDDLSLSNLKKCNDIIRDIRIPLILTLRSIDEGGNEINDDYFKVLSQCIESLSFDILDVEIDRPFDINSLINQAHQHDIGVIISHHDLKHVLGEASMIDKFKLMENHHADIAKIAIMPTDEKDVLELINASLFAKQQLQIPLISMAMGEKGMISRIMPSHFGSSVSFGSLDKSSAPGQINVTDLRRIINLLR